MLKFFKKLLKKGKKDKHQAVSESSHHDIEPAAQVMPSSAVNAIPTVAISSQVEPTIAPQVSQAPQAAKGESKPQESSSSRNVYGTRTKATAVKVKPKAENELKRQKNTAVKIPAKDNEQVLCEKAKEVAVTLEKHKKEDHKPESMQEELLRKSKEVRNRTHNHNKYYRGTGKDTYGLNGRELKSIFENDKGEKLPFGERAELMRELQNGTRKHTWR